ncbi:MAG: glycerol-3-phosphate acyltransferase, partial [Oscillospiraceae bacterium]
VLFVVFVLVVAVSRFVSLGSIACAVLYPLVTMAVLLFQGRPALGGTIFALLMSIIVFYMHRGNIRRLLDGTESRLGSKKNEK